MNNNSTDGLKPFLFHYVLSTECYNNKSSYKYKVRSYNIVQEIQKLVSQTKICKQYSCGCTNNSKRFGNTNNN